MNKMKHLFWGIQLLLLASCQENEILTNLKEDAKSKICTERIDSSFVNQELAAKVAASFTQVSTRSTPPPIDEIMTLFNDQKEPVMYVVNYKNDAGYVMISASKNYYPVLMKADHGKFNLNNLPEPAKWYVNTYKININKLKSAPFDSIWKYRQEWAEYEEQPKASTRASGSLSVEIQRFMDESRRIWRESFCEISPLSANDLNLPTDIYNRAIEDAEKSLREDYMETSFIIKKDEIENIRVEPLLSTTWDQNSPYNAAIVAKYGKNYPTGCVVTAMAQIMKYHRKPQNYNWDNMPDYSGLSSSYYWDVANLMLDIGKVVGIDYTNGSGANIEEAVKGFKSFGYNARMISHNQFTVKEQLLNHYPVYMRGKDGTENVGHAWVCDGIDDSYGRTVYYLMTLCEYSNGELTYIPHEIKVEDEYGLRYFHMNWGFRGEGNAWFRNDDILMLTKINDKNYNFKIKREDIIDIH